MFWLRQQIRFDRNELSGAIGDIGTDFPLLVGMILAAGLDAPSVLIMFGALQVMTGLVYGMPMPTQPLKAMAVIVITQKLAPNILYGGGLAIGAVMLLLTVTGLIGWVARIVPKSVVRGVQFGLGMQLASLALRDYVTSDGWPGYALAFVAFALTLALLGNRKFPPAPFIILLGIAYALLFKLDGGAFEHAVGISLPKLHTPQWADVLTGFLVLALPQLPLSLGNSILASQRVADDLFPEKKVTVPKISLTYSLMNLISPWFSGVPTCHGSGGIAGHHAFGGRTGGSVVIYGALYLSLGLFFGGGFQSAVKLFPLPVLGVILLFEALALMKLVRDMLANAGDFFIVLLVGLIAFGLPYGYVIGVLFGTLIVYFGKRILQAQPNADERR
ncbi:MAG: putative sulfate/molybdate transporter [Acidobacteria bacterium]|nr:putative sulfate/molybdate transporter [Acidobacteriota bacterium]MCL5287216.1 putative sulfate/molybdate transporter [Acidobacteriota bacterium]